jgi:nucleoside 2-deoxyribosyltransferase
MKLKIYVASSWRNTIQPMVVQDLRAAGHEVYDFRHPAPGNDGFQWSEIDPHWQGWKAEEFIQLLEHPVAERGFGFDIRALDNADVTVLVLPSGRSAHLEAGFTAGQGKPVIVLLTGPLEPELMYKKCYKCVTTIDAVVDALTQICLDRYGGGCPTHRDIPHIGCPNCPPDSDED